MSAVTPDQQALQVIEAAASEASLSLDGAALSRIERLFQLIADRQAQTNLVGDASPAGVAEHVVEALTLAAAWQAERPSPPTRVLDVGAGAGLAALTLAILWPEARVLAVEPRKLRAQFISDAAASLALGTVQVVAKSLHSADLKPEYDLATARAVWPPDQWLAKAPQVLGITGLAAVHGRGESEVLLTLLGSAGRVVQIRAVPGPRGHLVALVQPRRPGRT